MLIARLIADPDTLAPRLEAAQAALHERGVRVAVAQMLDFCGETMQIGSPDDNAEAMRAVLSEHFAPSDALVSWREPQPPAVFVSDMDSTMIGQECIDELADYAGRKDEIAGITERAMRGELDFEQALRERVRMLAGLPESAIADCLAERIVPEAGARTLVETLKVRGTRTILVTGGFHAFADPVASKLGFDEVVANRLAIVDGKLTGEVEGEIVTALTKRQTLLAVAEEAGEGAITLATGDGANDIPMLEAATYGIAYRAKPKARAAAAGWIERGDLSAILQLLGIERSEWKSEVA